MEVEKQESTKAYEDHVKTGLLLNNFEIKSKAETFPEGVAVDPELLPMKPKLEKPSGFDCSCVARAYRCGLSHLYGYKQRIDVKKIEAGFKDCVHVIGVQAHAIQASAYEWSIFIFEKLQAFFATFLVWAADARTKWYIEGQHQSERLIASMKKMVPHDALEIAFQEVRKAISTISRSYDKLQGKCLQKTRSLRRELYPVDTPICHPEEQKVAKCFEKLMSDSDNVIKCIGPLDMYKKCVESHAENLKW
ncbi:FHA domain-containing protein [Perkinsela sp. CCAP 1560/4]|nr:FHA domain-containing protein [Perkinsela sp. CCAP 1560/4]|eukprot:KNH08054.1 FHA domain-containing protein [Perkinsela sp. CCAP 1560/4]